jgi:sulfur-oxidizing protein SoxX
MALPKMPTAIGAALLFSWGVVLAQPERVAYRVENAGIRAPLTHEAGDPQRGFAAVTSRDSGNCVLCHAVPGGDERTMGNLAPPLAGVGGRLGAAELRLRVVDSSLVNPRTIMPAYHRVKSLNQVAAAYRGKPLLSAQQVEDVVAYLGSLR